MPSWCSVMPMPRAPDQKTDRQFSARVRSSELLGGKGVCQVFVNIASDSGRRHEEGTTSPCRAQQQCYHDRSRRDHQQ